MLPLDVVLESLFNVRDWAEDLLEEDLSPADLFLYLKDEFFSYVSMFSSLLRDPLFKEPLVLFKEAPDGLVKFLVAELVTDVLDVFVLELDGGLEDPVLAELPVLSVTSSSS